MIRNQIHKYTLRLISVLLLSFMLMGCGATAVPEPSQTAAPSETTTDATEPAATTPADGNPDDVTCRGSYTVDNAAFSDTAEDTVAVITVTYNKTVEVPQAAEESPEDSDEPQPTDPVYEIVEVTDQVSLTNRHLQVFYWLEVAAYRQAGHQVAPDFSQGLDTQICPLDDTVGSWQQYFLREALHTWAVSQALALNSQYVSLGFEDAYDPNEDNHALHFVDIPASSVYYGSHEYYTPNAMHQAYLDNLPNLLAQLAEGKGCPDAEVFAGETAFVSAQDIVEVAKLYNFGYMYFTELSYDVTPSAEDVDAYFTEHEEAYAEQGITRDSGKTVDMRHILLLPDDAVVAEDGTVTADEDAWERVYWTASNQMRRIKNTYPYNEGVFANAAANTSLDAGSAEKGGLYENIVPGQLPPELDSWLFEEARQPGDATVVRSAYGMHILYYSGDTELWYDNAEQDLTARLYQEQIQSILAAYPAQIDYSAIRLATAVDPVLTAEDLLYADVAHERFPVAPLYMQQDYPDTYYGAYPIVTHGCGITTLSMLATYMTDTELTPPILCKRYGQYNTLKGSDPTLFIYPPGEMGFYLKEQVCNSAPALEALEDGYIVVCLQKRGLWTRGGHFLLLEKLNENGTVQVRDSNLLNYSKLDGHKIDEFDWSTIPPKAASYWIYYPKTVRHPLCIRCAQNSTELVLDTMLSGDYLCSKCEAALLRRNVYLNPEASF